MVTVMVNGIPTDIADLTPSGAISMFGGLVVPSGWLLCNGQAVSRTTYAALFAAISTYYGNGDGSTTFNVPDMRGQFPRGFDNGAGVDPDASSRTAKNGGNSGNNIGSVQATATKLPTTAFTATASGTTGTESSGHTHGVPYGGSGGSTGTICQSNDTGSFQTGGESASHTHSFSGAAVAGWGGGDHESRPPNVYVNFIIKC